MELYRTPRRRSRDVRPHIPDCRGDNTRALSLPAKIHQGSCRAAKSDCDEGILFTQIHEPRREVMVKDGTPARRYSGHCGEISNLWRSGSN